MKATVTAIIIITLSYSLCSMSNGSKCELEKILSLDARCPIVLSGGVQEGGAGLG